MFSLIVPVYNLEEYIADCLESILAQTYPDFEVIVINDGSVDKSQEIINEFCHKDNRVISLTQSNQGVSSARNLGMQHTAGKWIWFIDGDDYIHPKALEWMNAIFVAHASVDYLTFEYIYTKQRYNNFFPDHLLGEKVVKSYNCQNDSEFQMALHDSPIAACCICFQRKISHGIQFQPIRTDEDRLFSLNLLARTQTVFMTKVQPYYYFQRSGSASRSVTSEYIHDKIHFIKLVIELSEHELQRGASYLQALICREHIPNIMYKIVSIPDFRRRKKSFNFLCDTIIDMEKLGVVPKGYAYLIPIANSRNYLKAYIRLYLRYVPRRLLVRSPKALMLFRKIKTILAKFYKTIFK